VREAPATAEEAALAETLAWLAQATQTVEGRDLDAVRRRLEVRIAAEATSSRGRALTRACFRAAPVWREALGRAWPALAVAVAALACLIFFVARHPAPTLQPVRFNLALWELDGITAKTDGGEATQMFRLSER
jgi:hypothetical protein